MDKNDLITCKRCGRILKNDKYRIIGYGNVCYKKVCIDNDNYLFDIDTFEINKKEVLENGKKTIKK